MKTDNHEPTLKEILLELARVRAIFQLRTIAAVIGAPMPAERKESTDAE